MIKSILPILLFYITINVLGQSNTVEFGRLNPKDIEIKVCSFEKDASAVVLFDYGSSEFIHEEGSGFVLSFKRHTRIKIFNEGGYDHAEIEIPLFISEDNRERVRDIKGYSYNINNNQMEQTPLEKSQVFEEQLNEHWYVKKFAMPKIKDGTIIEFTYIIDSPYITNFTDWEFQTDIPILYSEFKAAMIPFYSYRYRLQGASKFDHFKSYELKGIDRSFSGIVFHDMVYEFGLKNIPSLKDESFISSRNDYIKKIDFQLVEINYPSGYSKKYMDTWPSLANDLLDYEHFGKYLKKSEKWANKNAIQFATLPEEERYNTILDMVKSTYKWNEYYGYSARASFKEFQNELNGNIGNINLLTIGIMRANGIEAQPVIISTRAHGKVFNDFPYSDFFNYVLIMAKIDGHLKLLDATQAFCPNDLIPDKCINGKGFIVVEDSEQWVSINNNAPSVEETKLEYTINLDGYKIEGHCNKTCTGYIAINQRRKYYSDADNFKKEFEKLGFTEGGELVVNNLMEEEKPFEYSFSFNQDIDVIDEQIILNPFAYFPIKENPFKQEKRSLPIDMVNKKAWRYSAVITIPQGFKVDVMPAKKVIKSPNVEFTYLAQQLDDHKIKLYAIYNFNKSEYPAESYTELKSFMNTVTQKLNSKIVLIKDEQLTMK